MKTTKDFLTGMDLSDCIINIMAFLVSAEEEDVMYGGIKATESLIAFQTILGYDDAKFAKLKEIFK
jgi:hypothetical protein